MNIKPDRPLQVGDWQYLPEQDKLVQFDAAGKIAVTADLDNLSQKVANYFIVNAGKLITKDELLQDVWGIRDVSDGRVTRVIRVLRVALGDDTREPTYIETIPKRGYRFIAPVAEIAQAEPVEQSEPADQVAAKATRQRYWPTAAALAAVFALFIGALAWWFWPQAIDEADKSIPLLRYKPVTALDGLEFYQNVSEDERYLVYSYASPDNESVTVLMLEDLQEHKRIQITDSTFSSFGAAFNPDLTHIAYHRFYQNGRCSIRLVDFDISTFSVSNDSELTECGENSPSSRLVWSPDAKYVIYPTMNVNRQMVLMMKPVHGGVAEQLTNPPPSSFGDYAARFSFKGDKLVFLRGSGSSAQLWLLNLVNRELKMLVDITDTLPGNVGWTSDDKFVVYSSTPTAVNKVDVESGLVSRLFFTDYGSQEIQTLKNGQLYASVGNFAHVNIKQVHNALKSEYFDSKVVFSSNRNESYVEANPVAGGPTAVVSRRSGLPQVWLFYPNGAQQQLTYFESTERIRSMRFSPDGKSLVLQLHNELWVLSETGHLTKLPVRESQIITAPSWSHTGDYIYYTESLNGRWQIARYNVISQQIDAKPFALDQEMYLESFDGKYSFWRDSGSKKFYIKWFESGVVDEIPIVLPESQLWYKFQAMPSGIYFAQLLDDIYYQLKFFEFDSKAIKQPMNDEVIYHSRFTVSADEMSIYVLQSIRGDIDIAKLALP